MTPYYADDRATLWCWPGAPVRDDEPPEASEPEPTRAPVVRVPGQEAFDFGGIA